MGPTTLVDRASPDDKQEIISRNKVATVLVVTAVAYHYSLGTLVRNLGVETPLAYLALVPMIALLLAAGRRRPTSDEPDIHDRQLDFIVGLPLLLAALVIVLVMPARLSTMFWIWRLDLVSLPLFVAGAVAIVFGVRTLWRLRFPIGFLLLAWPLPYTVFLTNWLQSFTNLTIAGIKLALAVMPVARPVLGSDGSLFAMGNGGGEFVVSVAAACSGVNGMVGFLLAGVAFASMVRGRSRPKLAWLIGGLVLLCALNVGRILVIFAVGSAWGERVAIDGLHPYIGLVVFCIGVLIMIKAMPLFGLRMYAPGEQRGTAGATAPGFDVSSPTASVDAPRKVAVPRSRLALSVVVAVALLLGLGNRDLRHYELVASDLGEPRLASFSAQPPAPKGWSASLSDTYPWATRFFGDDSVWQRFTYGGGGASGLRSSAPVIADVVTTSDLGAFTTYGLEACYNFHGYRIDDTRSVDLGGGVTGQLVSYYNTSVQSDWTTLYWIWPVATEDGTRYERVVLMMVDSAKAQLAAPSPGPSLTRGLGLGVDNKLRADSSGAVDVRLDRTRDFLVSFSREVVARAAARVAPA